MKNSRRASLATTTAAIALPKVSLAQVPVPLRAMKGMQHIGADGFPDTEIWSDDGTVAGPTIRVKHGARVTREFNNDLPQ